MKAPRAKVGKGPWCMTIRNEKRKLVLIVARAATRAEIVKLQRVWGSDPRGDTAVERMPE